MEKVGALISRLQELYAAKSDDSSLLNTALLLVTELQNGEQKNTGAVPGKVSVILPVKPFTISTENTAPAQIETSIPEVEAEAEPELVPIVVAEEPKEEPKAEQPQVEQPEEPAMEPVQTSAINTLAEEKFNDVMEQIPTLAQQQPKVVYELNDTIQPDDSQSINDKLKQQVIETGGKLQSEPIRDLRKAIGINDKYRFVRELFRNDEAAYERSVKTINSFNILPEAEYWIQREMKYKLGWDDNDPTVKSFYLLVKRRFS